MFIQGSHAFAMFSAHALREGRGYARINVTTFTRFVQYCSMGALLAFYGSTMQCSCTIWVFRTICFLLSVPARLKKKKKSLLTLQIVHFLFSMPVVYQSHLLYWHLLRMLKLGVGKGRQVIKQLEYCNTTLRSARGICSIYTESVPHTRAPTTRPPLLSLLAIVILPLS